MDSRIQLRGRVASAPMAQEETAELLVGFVLENEQLGAYQDGRRAAASFPWCEIVCTGRLAHNVLRCVGEDDLVMVWGELRVSRPRRLEDTALMVVHVDAESVGHDLSHGVAAFLRDQS